MDCQGLVVRLIQDFVLLTTAVEVAQRWRDLAEKLAKVSKQQMDAYEAPHRDKNGAVDSEVRKRLCDALGFCCMTDCCAIGCGSGKRFGIVFSCPFDLNLKTKPNQRQAAFVLLRRCWGQKAQPHRQDRQTDSERVCKTHFRCFIDIAIVESIAMGYGKPFTMTIS